MKEENNSNDKNTQTEEGVFLGIDANGNNYAVNSVGKYFVKMIQKDYVDNNNNYEKDHIFASGYGIKTGIDFYLPRKSASGQPYLQLYPKVFENLTFDVTTRTFVTKWKYLSVYNNQVQETMLDIVLDTKKE